MKKFQGFRYAVPVVIACNLMGCGIGSLTQKGIYSELTPEQYASHTKDSSVYILDVRTIAEFNKSHIERAINVSYFAGHFRKNFSNLNLDSKKTILIYCETQHRSLFVARKIAREGFTSIIDLDKGMARWRKEGFPFIAGTNP